MKLGCCGKLDCEYKNDENDVHGGQWIRIDKGPSGFGKLTFIEEQIGRMNPLVRNLYKRIITVGKDYPAGLDHVRVQWKKALRDPNNCPACYKSPATCESEQACQEQLLHAVNRGRYMVKEMIGVIQLKKYRTLKQRYGQRPNAHGNDSALRIAMRRLEEDGREKLQDHDPTYRKPV
jgi:hypothetical protein